MAKEQLGKARPYVGVVNAPRTETGDPSQLSNDAGLVARGVHRADI